MWGNNRSRIDHQAREILSKKENVRLLVLKLENLQKNQILSVNGGLLIQDNDLAVISSEDLEVVSDRKPSKDEIENCLFWKVCKFVKSNAIVYTKDNQTIGIGAGQMSRIDSAQIAASKAVERALKHKDAP